jgi:DNA-binding Lrp family transcriptional regulator
MYHFLFTSECVSLCSEGDGPSRISASGEFDMKAYVLVNLQTVETAGVVDILRRVKGVVAADVTFGPYDAVAIVEAGDLNALGRIIVGEIRTLPGVRDTVTCLAVDAAR